MRAPDVGSTIMNAHKTSKHQGGKKEEKEGEEEDEKHTDRERSQGGR